MMATLQNDIVSDINKLYRNHSELVLLIQNGEVIMMSFSQLNQLITDAFSSDRGSKNLIILGTASLVTGYLFAAVTIANLREQEREAHYYNSTQMAEGLKFKIEQNETTVNSASPKNLLSGTLTGKDVFTIDDLVSKDYNLLRVAPDGTASRLNGSETGYDTLKSKVKVIFYEGDTAIAASSETVKTSQKFKVNLVAGTYSNTDFAAKSGHIYVAMFADADSGVVDGAITIGVDNILDPAFTISKTTIPLPDDTEEAQAE